MMFLVLLIYLVISFILAELPIKSFLTEAYSSSAYLYYCRDFTNFLYKFCSVGSELVLRWIFVSWSCRFLAYSETPLSNAFDSFP
jgi:hypothetical protein